MYLIYHFLEVIVANFELVFLIFPYSYLVDNVLETKEIFSNLVYDISISKKQFNFCKRVFQGKIKLERVQFSTNTFPPHLHKPNTSNILNNCN